MLNSNPAYPAILLGGLIASGGGYCMDAEGLKIELQPGMVWSIPKNTVHSFHTDQSELNVIAYHPVTDPWWFQMF